MKYNVIHERYLIKTFMFQLESNLHNLDREIEALRAAVGDKINPTKLVETRLEMRNRRPVLELVQVITTS